MLKVNAADKWKNFGVSAIFRMHKSGGILNMKERAQKAEKSVQEVPMGKIIGRIREQEILKSLFGSKKAEFIGI